MSKVYDLAKKFQIKLAQTVSAQPDTIEEVLTGAGLWQLSDKVSPLLNTAHVPEDCKVHIAILIDHALNVSFRVDLDPQNHPASVALSRLLKMKFSAAMKQALIKAKVDVAGTMEVGWLNF